MPAHEVREMSRSRFRTLFVSDVHIGSRYSQAERLLELLHRCEPERIYLVGDFIDGWRLKRRWHWQPVYVQIFQRLVKLATTGTQIFYTPGNHDEFLRDYLHDFGFVTVADEFVHQTSNGRRFVVLHGDRFDDVERRAKWLSIAGAQAYDSLVCANGLVNQFRRWFNLSDYRFSTSVKVWAKQAVQFISDFEERLVCHAKEQECDGVICGHIHVPRVEAFGDVLYCNTGDWVEHCTALVELETGDLELIEWSGGRMDSAPEFPRTCSSPIVQAQHEPATDNIAAAVINQMLARWRSRLASTTSASTAYVPFTR